jgi:2-polyprenyl-3-methyl-5-hydroxy-6-metoxy-1,4-benzoquinol methylase
MEQSKKEITNQSGLPLKCLLCGSQKHRTVFKEFDVDILRCLKCNHVFSSYPADTNYDGFWGMEVPEDEHFYWNEAHAKMHDDFFQRFLIGRSGRLLDVGCGLGFFLKAMAPYQNWEGYGCEVSQAAVGYAQEILGLPNIICGQLENSGLPYEHFDIITMFDVIEHLIQPDPLLRHCYQLLKNGGICFIHTPNVTIQLPRAKLIKLLRGMKPGVTYMQAHDHLHYYSMSSINRLLERNGFSRIEFIHMHPVQSVQGRRSRILRETKNAWSMVARTLANFSRGHFNFNNLFIVAHKDGKM